MKIRHKVNHDWWPGKGAAPDISDSYAREIAESGRKAEKRWRDAQRRLERAERVAAKRPEPITVSAVEELRREVADRLEELRQIEQLMRADAPSAERRPVRIANKRRSEL